MKSRLNKEIWGWAIYDWANSAYAVSILAVIFQFYFIDVVATSATGQPGHLAKEIIVLGNKIPSASLWAWSVSLSMLLTVIVCPVLGAISDSYGRKKSFLFFFCYTGAFATMLMVFLAQGMWKVGVFLFILSNIGFVAGNVFYNGLLTDIVSSHEDIGFVSTFGWGLGYLASFLVLLFELILIRSGIPSPESATRLTFLGTGLWWALFAIPTFLWVEGEQVSRPVSHHEALLAGFSRLGKTARSLTRYSELLLFLGAFFLYNDGIQTIISQSATFANYALKADLTSILPAFLLIQIVAFFGSLIFIKLEKKIGTKTALIYSLAVWALIIAWAMVMKSLVEFYLMSVLGGLVLGGSQAASRTIYTMMIPRNRSAEFFSLYMIVGKMASIAGPVLFGIGALYSSRLEDMPLINNMAGAIFPLFLMVMIGALLLLTVDVEKGRRINSR